MPGAPDDGAAAARLRHRGTVHLAGQAGAHHRRWCATGVDVPPGELEPLVEGLRIMTVAPEIPGGLELIAWLAARGVKVSIGHSAATVDEARAGYAAGGRTTTHLFNGMSGVDHRAPGLARGRAHRRRRVCRAHRGRAPRARRGVGPHQARQAGGPPHPRERRALAVGHRTGRTMVGATDVEVLEDRAVVAGTTTLAGSVVALDGMLRNLVRSGASLPAAVARGERQSAGAAGRQRSRATGAGPARRHRRDGRRPAWCAA